MRGHRNALLLWSLSLLATTAATSGQEVFEFDFTGNSGGIPAGWAVALGSDPDAAYVESGTVVSITDATSTAGGNGPAIISFTTPVDSTPPITYDVEVDGGFADPGALPEPVFGLGRASGAIRAFVIILQRENNDLRAIWFEGLVGEDFVFKNALPSYADGPVDFSLQIDGPNFRLLADDGFTQFDSGDIAFTTAFPTNGPNDFSEMGAPLGMSVGASANEVGEGALLEATVEFDRVVLTTPGDVLIFSDGFEDGTTNAWN